MRCRVDRITDLQYGTTLLLEDKPPTYFLCERNVYRQNTHSAIAEKIMKEMLRNRYENGYIQLIHNSTGKPMALIDGKERGTISITHDTGYIAVAFSEACLLGIDIQRMISWDNENKRLAAFSSHELSFIENSFGEFNALTALWAAKEAVLKAIGIGLSKGFHYVELLTDFKDSCEIVFKNNMEKRMREPMLYLLELNGAVGVIFLAK